MTRTVASAQREEDSRASMLVAVCFGVANFFFPPLSFAAPRCRCLACGVVVAIDPAQDGTG